MTGAPLAGGGDGVGVLGGGAVGLTAAADLAARGVDVTLYERHAPGSAASGHAAGIVHDAFAEDVDARVAGRAIERFRAFAAGDGVDPGDPSTRGLAASLRVADTPYVWLASEPGPEAEAIREAVPRMRRHGRDVARVDAADLRVRFPQLAVDDVAAAAVAEDAAVVDPPSYVAATAERARAAGATIRDRTPARLEPGPGADEGATVVVDGERIAYDAVVVACGARTRTVLADAGIGVPLAAYPSQAHRFDGPAIPTVFDATAGRYVRPARRGLVAGGTTEPSVVAPDDWRPAVDREAAAATAAFLDDRLLNYTGTIGDAWADLCVATPDGDPLLGPVAPGVTVAAGWNGRGFMLAPATGEAVAEQLCGAADPPAPYDPLRFDGDEVARPRSGTTLEPGAFGE